MMKIQSLVQNKDKLILETTGKLLEDWPMGKREGDVMWTLSWDLDDIYCISASAKDF